MSNDQRLKPNAKSPTPKAQRRKPARKDQSQKTKAKSPTPKTQRQKPNAKTERQSANESKVATLRAKHSGGCGRTHLNPYAQTHPQELHMHEPKWYKHNENNSLSKSSDSIKRSFANFMVCESLRWSHKLIDAISNVSHSIIRQLPRLATRANTTKICYSQNPPGPIHNFET